MYMQEEQVVIGIDGGGTHIRVMVCSHRGHVLSYLERGSASIYKDEISSTAASWPHSLSSARAGCGYCRPRFAI